MKHLLSELTRNHPDIAFAEAESFYWAPDKGIVYYAPLADDKRGCWSLLHELSHAILGHTTYKTDLELLLMEAAAWERAKVLITNHDSLQAIDEEHIQDCLDTYRDWLYARSTCPTCDQTGIQKDHCSYACINCQQLWKISSARFKRPYRLCVDATKKTSPAAINEQVKFY